MTKIPAGGKYKLESIKTFASKENLHKNVKKYRKVFDEIECRYIYSDLCFYNKLFDEEDWDCKVRIICTNLRTEKQVCDINKDIHISKAQNIVHIREGWGTPDPGWWKKGIYKWECFIDGTSVGTAQFYVIKAGLPTEISNPYFNISSIRLFESPRGGTPIKDREYLSAFSSKETRYINIEMTVENLMTDLDDFPFEMIFNFYNDSGQHKAMMTYFRNFTDNRKTITFDTGYGSDKGGFWYEDNYTLHAIFMDQLIAVIPLKVTGEKEVLTEPSATFSTNTNAVGKVSQGSIKTEVTFEEAKKELEALIGLSSVKMQINDLATYIQFLKIREEKGIDEGEKLSLHTIFSGNPGTGKTTVARMLGKIYNSLGLLTHGKVIEVGRADLVGEFIGQTAPKVKKIVDKAKGGILFIDEAYALTNRGGDKKDFGNEVIEVLLKTLTDVKDLCVIFAGYPEEMNGFLSTNPGMASRVKHQIDFPDYSPDELMQIADYSCEKRKVSLAGDARVLIHNEVVETYRNRNKHFGNARYVNGIIDEAKQNMALRLMDAYKNPNKLDEEKLSLITYADVEKVFSKGKDKSVNLPIDEPLLHDAMQQLNDLIGLTNIKEEVEDMVKLVRYYREIGKDLKKAFSLHTVFKGNPGTGKTTLARIVVQLYKALGILERGQLVECSRKDLVAGYIGQTAIKTNEVIDRAIGGGLFIDEAYALYNPSGKDFGREAIETLLKRMEDQRGEFMVIVAGYPEEMRVFLETNPGLMSRFDKEFTFEDYNHQELIDIALLLIEKEELILAEDAKAHLVSYIEKMMKSKHKYFGNGRTIRKIVKEVVRNQHLRMADMPAADRSPELIRTILLDDVKDFSLVEQENERKTIGFGRQEIE